MERCKDPENQHSIQRADQSWRTDLLNFRLATAMVIKLVSYCDGTDRSVEQNRVSRKRPI